MQFKSTLEEIFVFIYLNTLLNGTEIESVNTKAKK